MCVGEILCSTRIEVDNLISQNVISSMEDKGWGGTRKLPYAFTEQGIYMLMTVLKGELAVWSMEKIVKGLMKNLGLALK